MRRSIPAALALVALLLCAIAVPGARADGDPASDYLLQRVLFVPPDAGISSSDTARLRSLLLDARAKGYTLHVAVVASRYDMGSIPELFTRPKTYSRFLSQEMKFIYKKRVLVVMPRGYSIASDGKALPAEQKVVDRLKVPTPFKGAPLAAATEKAIRALTLNAGIHVRVLPIAAKSGTSSSNDRAKIIGGALVLLAILVAFRWTRRGWPQPRRRR